MSVTLGIDPGLDGAIALLVDGELFDVADMPTYKVKVGKKDRRRLDCEALETILVDYGGHTGDPHTHPNIVIEQPQPRPGNGAIIAYSSGVSWGGMIELVRHLGWLVTLVRPQQWKADTGVGADKTEARELASAIWPERAELFVRVKDADRAEAALIARWSWMLRAAA